MLILQLTGCKRAIPRGFSEILKKVLNILHTYVHTKGYYDLFSFPKLKPTLVNCAKQLWRETQRISGHEDNDASLLLNNITEHILKFLDQNLKNFNK
jgi:hypothetical protein